MMENLYQKVGKLIQLHNIVKNIATVCILIFFIYVNNLNMSPNNVFFIQYVKCQLWYVDIKVSFFERTCESSEKRAPAKKGN